jgi:hypothetical protein
MGTRAAAIFAVVVVTGCGSYGSEAFHCDTAAQCPSNGTCDTSVGFCTQPSSSCTSGSQYTDHSGGMSGACVGGMAPVDSGTDAPPDARLCFGNAPFTICLASAPTAPMTIVGVTPLNTDTSNKCVATTSGGTGYCVVVGTTISIEEGSLRATGTKPLVLISSDSITVSTLLDVSSHHTANPATTPEAGAGANPAVCTSAAGIAPTVGGGGAGGSFAGTGGIGAVSAFGGSTGGSPGAAAAATALRGGCPGQDGQGSVGDRGPGGHGGGAVLLIAVNSITITGEINAAGQGGSAGIQNTSGGGGGGAGGMIVLDAQTVMNTGLLLANGGGGGEGSGENTPGTAGADSTGATAAAGGSSGAILPNGGDGGSGSSGVAAGPGAAGSAGTVAQPGNHPGAGGGGGGGAGLIKTPTGATLGTMVSPASTH